jgi:hypothetical protein
LARSPVVRTLVSHTLRHPCSDTVITVREGHVVKVDDVDLSSTMPAGGGSSAHL